MDSDTANFTDNRRVSRKERSTSDWEPTGTAVETYSSMTALRIDSERRSSEPVERIRRATLRLVGAVERARRNGIWDLGVSTLGC